MRSVAAAALFASWAVSVIAATPSTHVVHEKRNAHDAMTWHRRERLEGSAQLPLRIGLKQNNLDKAHDLLMDVSDPSSSNFGKHYNTEDVVEMFRPAQDTIDLVKAWLAENNIDAGRIHHSNDKGWLAVDLSTAEAEGLLLAEYHEYEHTETGAKVTSCEDYRLPKHIQQHVDYITPGVSLFASPRSRKSARAERSKRAHEGHGVLLSRPPVIGDVRVPVANSTDTCDQTITPECIKALYKVPVATKANPSNAIGIFEEGDTYAQEDLDLFFAKYAPNIPNGTHPTPAFIDGASAPVSLSQAGGESSLDFQLAYPLIYPQKITLYQTDDYDVANGIAGEGTAGVFNTFLDALDGSYCTYSAYGEKGDDPVLDPKYPDEATKTGYKGKTQCGVYKPANVISISYGVQESDLPYYYQQRQCNEFMKLGLQGVSIFVASGDTGVAGPNGDGAANGCLNGGNVFSPTFPNSCPYVTNVGATKVYPGHKVTDAEPESAANDAAGHPYRTAYSSGGGFSNIYSIPDYQGSSIASYFGNHDPGYKSYSALHNATYNDTIPIGANGGLYNRIGRGIPDVAANGDNIITSVGGKFSRSGGTSASAPIFASIVNLINEERLSAGKGPVGFVNPALYKNPSVLNDIKNGSNPGCGTNGFDAVQGWDPVTGLGTPNYPKMLEYFMKLP